MTLSERESTEKWSEIDTVLKQLETIVEQLVKDAERVEKAEREEVAKLHAEVAHMMTRLEDIKLMTTLSTADYKENSIHAQLGILEKYLNKARRGLKSGDKQRILSVNKEAARRTIEYHLEPVEQSQ